MPSTRVSFWQEKLERNKERDKQTRRKLRRDGWDVLVVWECQLRDADCLSRRLGRFLDNV